MKIDDLIKAAETFVSAVNVAKELGQALASNVEKAKDVLSAEDIAAVKAIYSRADLTEAHDSLDAAIGTALSHGH